MYCIRSLHECIELPAYTHDTIESVIPDLWTSLQSRRHKKVRKSYGTHLGKKREENEPEKNALGLTVLQKETGETALVCGNRLFNSF